MSQAKIVQLLLAGREKEPKPGEPAPRIGIQMPTGGEILGATIAPPSPGERPQVMLAVLSTPNAVISFLPILMCGLGELITPMIGRKVGKCVATTSNPQNGLPVFIFLDEPAASGLVGLEVQGRG